MVKDKYRSSYLLLAALDVTTKEDEDQNLTNDERYKRSEEKRKQFTYKLEKLAIDEGYLLNIFVNTPELNEPLYNVVLQEFDLETTVKEELKTAKKLKTGGYYKFDTLNQEMYHKIMDKKE